MYVCMCRLCCIEAYIQGMYVCTMYVSWMYVCAGGMYVCMYRARLHVPSKTDLFVTQAVECSGHGLPVSIRLLLESIFVIRFNRCQQRRVLSVEERLCPKCQTCLETTASVTRTV
jgi:hypothetical protein